MKIGTAISKVATPIARLVGADCYDPLTGDLKPESPCAKTRERLDAAKNPKEFASAIFDRFWSNNKKGDTMTDDVETPEKKYYTLVVLVEAGDAVEALTNRDKGKVLAVNPQQPRPQQGQVTGNRVGGDPTGVQITKGQTTTQRHPTLAG